MKAIQFNAPGDVTLVDRPDPVLVHDTDVIVRVAATCVCGSDLWPYRGETPRHAGSPIGHEFIGTVEQSGSAVASLAVGDFVIAPFTYNDGTCPDCLVGMTSVCKHGGIWGAGGNDGGQGEFVRVPFADATLVTVPGGRPDDSRLPSLLALSDVFGTGHHAAVSAGVVQGSTVAVVGDGAVGLSGVLAAKRLGAGRIIALSRHPERQAIAREFGATEIVSVRGDEAVAAVLDLTDGVGVDASLECVGTGQAMSTAFAIARPGSTVGFVGVPHGVELPIRDMFDRNIGLSGGVAPVRAYLPELLADVLAGLIDPGRVFDFTTALDGIPDGYRAMDERRAVKAMAIL
ncbi:zinc-dependent alcohol dehydrogenase family protein [Plantibacter sp. YIM 135249]|uniref:zinc-dependent alcohol dehydrogenase family protein n=1 Tax=Plantibacter sp. YIM 135249 TaxID=3423918 RepID=UPI003D340182